MKHHEIRQLCLNLEVITVESYLNVWSLGLRINPACRLHFSTSVFANVYANFAVDVGQHFQILLRKKAKIEHYFQYE